MKIDCLFDTHSILKIYVPFRGSQVIKYLFEKSPTARINIASTQIVEVISLFYKFKRQGAFSAAEERDAYIATFLNDIKIGKIKVYDFAKEQIKDLEVYRQITDMRPPNKRRINIYVPEWDGYYQEVKEPTDSIDTIMLLIMREMDLVTGKQAYLFSSNAHVKEVASALQLNIIDPEKTCLAELPQDLLLPRASRLDVDLRVSCIDSDTALQLDTARAINISEGGLGLETSVPLEVGKRLEIKELVSGDGSKKIENIPARVVWYNQPKNQAGLQFLSALNSYASFS